MTNYREILRLYSLGLNKTQIAQSISCSRTTVIQVLNVAEEKGISYPLPEDLSDRKLSELLFPSDISKPEYKMPDYEYVHGELQKNGVTLNLLWLEYCEKCREEGELPYQLTQFKKHYRDYAVKKGATMHLNHKPGEIMQVDWAGDTATVIDTDTSETIPAYVFVSSLPYSGYAYVEVFFSMNQECWIAAHVNAFRYYGGVTRILQCDNLKTVVISHGRSEITLNKAYNEMAEHYGTAILPCRVRAPKDKAMVEGTVGVISNFILGALRNRRFLSLAELNEAIFERLEIFNHKPFQKRDGSRASEFEEEKPFLLPLPKRPFELSEWKIATVAPNYHISVDKQNYSVPYEYIKQKVDVRITRSTVEVFFGGKRICSHPRLYGRANQYSTVEAHMPPNHQQYVQWNGDRFRKWAAKIGEATHTVIDALLSGYKVEQQGYKACMGILKLADKYSGERLESACSKALTFTPRPSLFLTVRLYPGSRILRREAEVMLTENTVNKLYEMRLTAMAKAFKDQMSDPNISQLPFEDRFGLLVDQEWTSRKNNHLKRLIKQAKFAESGACVEDIEYHADRNLDGAQIARLSTCNFITERHNILLLGATGSGKTYIACALGMAAARNFLQVRYVRLPELLTDLAIARGNGTFPKVIQQYKKPALLILDEWLLYPLKETEARDLLEIAEARYKKASTIFCSQFDVPGWREKIGDPILADAICDRIVHDSYSIVIDCKESMRKRKGVKKNEA